MRRGKKLILIEVLTAVVLVASLGIAAVAHANDEQNTEAGSNTTSLMEEVATIYEANTGTAIDPQELENAFKEACEQHRTEILNNCLDKLVEQGQITQEQADEFKTWLDTRPDNMFTDEFQEWLNSGPDILGMFGQHDGGGIMFFGKQNGRLGFGESFRISLHDCCFD